MFGKSCSLIGVLHLPPLPGARGFSGSVEAIVETALEEAAVYRAAGFDALKVENTHDVPYLRGIAHPETVAAMSVVCSAVKSEMGLPLGVQILAGANIEALSVALAASLDFIRVEGFVYAHIGDEGIHQACAGELIRKRYDLRSERILIFADIKKKHSSHAITSDISLAQTAIDAENFRADGVIVTGESTGRAADLADLRAVRDAVDISVLVGSGVTPENITSYAALADALIIGSCVKRDGDWRKPLEVERCERLVAAVRG